MTVPGSGLFGRRPALPARTPVANPGSTAVKRIGSGLFRRSDAPEGEPGRTRAQDITLHEHNLADWERAFGPDHPDTLNGRDRLAHAYLAAGATARPSPY